MSLRWAARCSPSSLKLRFSAFREHRVARNSSWFLLIICWAYIRQKIQQENCCKTKTKLRVKRQYAYGRHNYRISRYADRGPVFRFSYSAAKNPNKMAGQMPVIGLWRFEKSWIGFLPDGGALCDVLQLYYTSWPLHHTIQQSHVGCSTAPRLWLIDRGTDASNQKRDTCVYT